mmetsp:Transcript_19381/g.58342  ORF Transcript_19381/g.58342 Transcript_19381/m.58342 type:complete len:221 (-) Transcript_19381:38-700(-)
MSCSRRRTWRPSSPPSTQTPAVASSARSSSGPWRYPCRRRRRTSPPEREGSSGTDASRRTRWRSRLSLPPPVDRLPLPRRRHPDHPALRPRRPPREGQAGPIHSRRRRRPELRCCTPTPTRRRRPARQGLPRSGPELRFSAATPTPLQLPAGAPRGPRCGMRAVPRSRPPLARTPARMPVGQASLPAGASAGASGVAPLDRRSLPWLPAELAPASRASGA